MSQPSVDLEQQAEEFGQEMDGLLRATLPGLPDPPTETLFREGRAVIRPPGAYPLPLYVNGQRLASMKLSVSCELDSVGRYLAVKESSYDLLAEGGGGFHEVIPVHDDVGRQN